MKAMNLADSLETPAKAFLASPYRQINLPFRYNPNSDSSSAFVNDVDKSIDTSSIK